MFTKVCLLLALLAASACTNQVFAQTEDKSTTAKPVENACKPMDETKPKVFEHNQCDFKCLATEQSIMKNEFDDIHTYNGSYCSTACEGKCEGATTLSMEVRYNRISLAIVKQPRARVCFVNIKKVEEPVQDNGDCEACTARVGGKPFYFLCPDLDKQNYNDNQTKIVFEIWGPLADERFEYIGRIQASPHGVLAKREVFKTLEMHLADKLEDSQVILTWSNASLQHHLSAVVLAAMFAIVRLFY